MADATHGMNGPYNTFLRNRHNNQKSAAFLNCHYVNFIGNDNISTVGYEQALVAQWIINLIVPCTILGDSEHYFDCHFWMYDTPPNWSVYQGITHDGWYAYQELGDEWASYVFYHSFLNDISYFYNSRPEFIPESSYTWPPNGPCYNLNYDLTFKPTGWRIPAEDRYLLSKKTYFIDPTPHPKPVSGTQYGDWYGCKIVKGDVTVPSGSTLNIEHGTVVVFDGYYQITVASGAKIIANGTAESPILFTNASQNLDNKWKYIRLFGGDNEFKHCTFEYGLYPVYLYYCTSSEGAPNLFENCVFRNNANYGIRFYRSVAEVVECEFKNSGYIGLRSYCSDVNFTGNRIYDNDSCGVYSTISSNLDFYRNVIESNGSHGLRTSNADHVNLGEPYTWQGKNTVRDNIGYELYAASGNSTLDLCHSSVHGSGGTDYEVYNYASNTEDVDTLDCWRGADNTWQYSGSFSFVYCNNGLPTWDGDIFTSGPLSKVSFPVVEKDDFLIDPSLPETEQIGQCRTIIEAAPDIKEAVEALTILYGILRSDFIENESGWRDEFYNYLENLWNSHSSKKLGQRALRYLIKWHMLGGNDDRVIELSKKAVKVLSKEEGGLVLGDLAMTYLHQGNLEDAKICLGALKKSFRCGC
ncbi:right-handed parallel beta-helix repeat-containing protein [bacterium]|nr:right-handed parallel beta-helix repeat-containing protein [bacterium]